MSKTVRDTRPYHGEIRTSRVMKRMPPRCKLLVDVREREQRDMCRAAIRGEWRDS